MNLCVFETVKDTNMKYVVFEGNNLKTEWKLIKVIWRCSIYAPLVTLQASTQYSSSYHVGRNCDSSTLAVACEIRSKGLWHWKLVCLVFHISS
jgi:hypothetical protein